MRSLVIAVAAALIAGCAGRSAPDILPFVGADHAWSSTLKASQRAAARNEFQAADSALVAFARRYPSSSEALEANYWRAVYKLDPNNRDRSVGEALASLDAYLGDTRQRDHVVEASMLRRLTGELDGLSRLAASALSQAREATAVRVSSETPRMTVDVRPSADSAQIAQDAELKRLREELAKANAELERIRRRLAQPPPGKAP